MKIIVTGGAGFIGSHLTDALINAGHEVVVVDNLSTGKRENVNEQAKFVESDITDFPSLLEIFEQEQPQGVFHLAAIPRAPLSIEDPVGTSKANILGTVNVLKAAADVKAQRVVFASSSSVYGDQATMPLKETMIPAPISPYGLQKLVGEQFAKVFSDLYELPVVSLRYFSVYGPRIDVNSDYSLVLGKFLKQHKEGKPLTIFGDGTQTRAFCYVDDVVKANIRAMESAAIQGGEVINVGGDTQTSINELAELIGSETTHLPVRVGDMQHTQADLSEVKRLLEWEPVVSFSEGVKRTIEWFHSAK
ncbi:MAG: NAD-dependent epimerase/dehydratase family protein [Patescibacteria group bacterium]|nr:NAD-dependent epimerase/dehydratase family protein [Patescibacteria group bacterium]